VTNQGYIWQRHLFYLWTLATSSPAIEDTSPIVIGD